MKPFSFYLILFSFIFDLSNMAYSQISQTFTIDEDISISSSSTYSNTATTLEIERNTGSSLQTNAILETDFSSLPVDAIILSATLDITASSASSALDLIIQRNGEAWDENTINWSTAISPLSDDELTASIPALTASVSHSIDITGHVQNMVNYPYNNHGWSIKLDDGAGAPNGSLSFYSSDDVTNYVEISVQYYASPLTITCSATHCSPGGSNGTATVSFSGGTGDYRVLQLFKVNEVSGSTAENSYTMIEGYNGVGTFTNPKTFTNSLGPGLYVVLLRDDMYFTTSGNTDYKNRHFSRSIYFVIGEVGVVTTGLIADYRHVSQSAIGINMGTYDPLDFANYTYGVSGNSAALRANDSGTDSYGSSTAVNYQYASLLNLNMFFDPAIDYIDPNLHLRGWTAFSQSYTSSNAMEYNLVADEWNPRIVTWNSRPDLVIPTPNIKLPKTANPQGTTPGHTYDVIDLSDFITEWKDPSFGNNGIQIGLDDYGAYPKAAHRGYKYVNKNLSHFRFSFTVKEANELEYVNLKRKLDGSFYNCDEDNDLLRVKYHEEYIDQDGNLSFSIKNSGGINSTIPIPQVVYGDNRIDFDVSTLASGFYILKVTNEKNETFYLRFKKA